MNSLLLLFDAPAMVSTCGQRTTSTVPLQSLALLNSGFARHRSSAFAARLLQETSDDENRRLDVAFQLTFGRGPTTSERAAASSMLHAQRAAYAPNSDAELHATSDLCQMLFASNAFLYVE